jgi:hypothetical protein
MEVIKKKSEVGAYDICIKESEDKSLALIWGGNGDLYWLLDNLEEMDVKEDPMYDTFCITKKDYAIYSMFEELYDDLMNGRIYLPEEHMNTHVEDLTEEEKEEVEKYNAYEIEHAREENEDIKRSARYQLLTADNVVTWYSDEEERRIAEIVRISKQEDSILLEFIRQSKKDDLGDTRLPGYYSIRFRTSGSTYTPCDLVFTRHFLKMQEYDFDAPQQIHIEEWCYREKQLKKKQ